VRRERGDGQEAADIGRMPAVDITLGQRCCGHAPDRATAGTYPQPLSASKCPCWWPRLRCRAGDVSESGGLTGGCIPAAVVEQLRDRPRLDRRRDIGNPWNRSWNELRDTTERRGCQGPCTGLGWRDTAEAVQEQAQDLRPRPSWKGTRPRREE